MIYSAACAYAIRALARLTIMRPDGYVLIDELCEGTDLPRHFVAKIFQDLVRKGLLTSAKGRGGGVALSRPPEEIRLWDIVAVVDGIEDFDRCVVGMDRCDDQVPCPQHDEWKVLREQIRTFLETTTLARMSNTLSEKLQAIGRELPQPKSKSKPVKKE